MKSQNERRMIPLMSLIGNVTKGPAKVFLNRERKEDEGGVWLEANWDIVDWVGIATSKTKIVLRWCTSARWDRRRGIGLA